MTTDAGQVADLEKNILGQAQRLAEEHLANGRAARENILRENSQRLRLREEHEIQAARAEGERLYRRRVQAAEIHLRADTDRLRWTLVSAVMDQVRTRLGEVAESAEYAEILRAYLREAAQAMGVASLHARLNGRDRPRFAASWQALAQQAAPGIAITLDEETFAGSGGVMALSEDGRMRVDNSFEGRMERMQDGIYRIVMERLFSAAPHTGALHG